MSKILFCVQTVDARDLPHEVEEYCNEREFWTHGESGIHQVSDDGNVLSEWLKREGYDFDEGGFVSLGTKINNLGIIAT